MGLPSLNMVFQQLGSTAIQRGTRGIVAVLLKDAVPTTNPIIMEQSTDIPKTLTAENQEQLLLTFKGYIYPPKEIIAYVVPVDTTDFTPAQKYLETIKWDYFAFPEIGDTDVTNFQAWEKTMRDSMELEVKCVLPNCTGDYEGIIDFASSNLKSGVNTYTAKQYCARIAGLLAGTPLSISATYAPLPELDDCDHLIKPDADSAIDAGKLIVINDGRKVKIARAINSLTTVTATEGSKFKKIKLIDIMDQAKYDISCTIEDNYTGKTPNDYDHKVLLMSAIKGYFQEMENSNLLQKGQSVVSINLEAQKAYLKSISYTTTSGKTVDTMSDQEIKEALTDNKVFLTASIKEIDAMEDFSFNVGI